MCQSLIFLNQSFRLQCETFLLNQLRSSDEDQMPGRPNFLNVHFTTFEYISHNMWYIFKCSFKITRAWRLVKSGSLDQQAGEMPDLDSDASRKKSEGPWIGIQVHRLSSSSLLLGVATCSSGLGVLNIALRSKYTSLTDYNINRLSL